MHQVLPAESLGS